MTRALLFCGRMLARFHQWGAAVFVYSLARPVAGWDQRSRGSFTYSCLLSRTRRGTQTRFLRIAERERGRSADVNLWLAKTAWCLDQPALALECYGAAEQLGTEMSKRQIVRTIFQFMGALADQTIYTEVSRAVDQISLPQPGDLPILLTVLSSNYFDLFDLWMEQTRRHTRCHLLIMALDQASKLKVQREPGCSVIDFSSYFVFQENGKLDSHGRSMIWVLRVLLLRELVSRGYVIYSLDLDAVLLSDLETILRAFPDADIVAQRDYSIPMDVARELGFILCCGFMAIRPNSKTLAFLNLYCEQTIRELDDQLALNHLLQREGITAVERRGSMSFRACGISWACPDESVVSRQITYGSVIRHFQQRGETIAELKRAMGL